MSKWSVSDPGQTPLDVTLTMDSVSKDSEGGLNPVRRSFLKTRLVVILDESGSMSSQRQAMVWGFNQFLRQQKAENLGEATLSLLKFDSTCNWVMDSVSLSTVPEMRSSEYRPGSGTALYDAMGMGMESVNQSLDMIHEEMVMCLIMTDGEENKSRIYTSDKIKAMVAEREALGNWAFVYIGVKPLGVCRRLGIRETNAANWSEDMGQAFGLASRAASEVRTGSSDMSAEWSVSSEVSR
jgi:hypothetical protein